jgi:hypothetical protein
MFGNGNANATHPLSSHADAGDPVRRGFSAQSPLPLEYWIARSSQVEPGDDHGEDMLTPSQIVINYNYSVQEPKSRWETPTLPRLPIMPRC